MSNPANEKQAPRRYDRGRRRWRPGRLVVAGWRRLRLMYLRCRHPQARFAGGSDVRARLSLRLDRGAEAAFGPRCVLDRELTIECAGRLDVGADVIFGHHCTLAVEESLTIGSDCLIAEMVSIRDHDHRSDRLDLPIRKQGRAADPVHIGSNVWLASKVTVLKGVSIGDHTIVGANAVVTRDLPPYSVAVGIPARVIRTRHSTDLPHADSD